VIEAYNKELHVCKRKKSSMLIPKSSWYYYHQKGAKTWLSDEVKSISTEFRTTGKLHRSQNPSWSVMDDWKPILRGYNSLVEY